MFRHDLNLVLQSSFSAQIQNVYNVCKKQVSNDVLNPSSVDAHKHGFAFQLFERNRKILKFEMILYCNAYSNPFEMVHASHCRGGGRGGRRLCQPQPKGRAEGLQQIKLQLVKVIFHAYHTVLPQAIEISMFPHAWNI